jgi:hypothetical protein
MRIGRFRYFPPTRSAMISPGRACRSNFDFSKIAEPSRCTSKRPPLDGTSVTCASLIFSLISAARPTARGS